MAMTARECIENVKICLRWADMAKTAEDRRAFTDLAKIWITASDAQTRRSLPVGDAARTGLSDPGDFGATLGAPPLGNALE